MMHLLALALLGAVPGPDHPIKKVYVVYSNHYNIEVGTYPGGSGYAAGLTRR
jgi:hypothetical protein